MERIVSSRVNPATKDEAFIDEAPRLPHEMLLHLFEYIKANSLKDLQSCRLVCKSWKIAGDELIVLPILQKKYEKWIKVAVDSSSKFPRHYRSTTKSTLYAKLARIVPTQEEATQLLEKALKEADEIGARAEKPQEDDDYRARRYLKIIKSFVKIGNIEAILPCIGKSKQAQKIARYKFQEDLQIYVDFAQFFIPLKTVQEVIELRSVFRMDYKNSLLVKLIKLYGQETQNHESFLQELDTIWKQDYEKSYQSHAYWEDWRGGKKHLNILKGYSLLGHFDRAQQMIAQAESAEVHKYRVEDKKIWINTAYEIIAKASLHRREFDQTRQALKHLNPFTQNIFEAQICLIEKKEEAALVCLQAAEKHKNSNFFRIVPFYLQMKELWPALRCIKELEGCSEMHLAKMLHRFLSEKKMPAPQPQKK